MNTNNLTSIKLIPRISLIPSPVTYMTYYRHPIFWWHKKHVRSVICELIVDHYSGTLKAEYTDERTGNIFINKKSAEHYLNKKIPDSEHIDKLYMEKVREVNTYYMCKECRHVGHSKEEVLFFGPFDLVLRPINKEIDKTCPNCIDATVQMDISTELSPENKSTEDCDLAR